MTLRGLRGLRGLALAVTVGAALWALFVLLLWAMAQLAVLSDLPRWVGILAGLAITAILYTSVTYRPTRP